MIRTLPLAALLILAACGPSAESPPPANDVADAPAKPDKPAVPSLEGTWRVTMIGGSEAGPLGMTARLGDGQASLSAGCARRAWTYTQRGNVVDFTAAPSGSSSCAGQVPGHQEEAAFSAMDGASIAIFSQKGARADLSGDGGTLTLERR